MFGSFLLAVVTLPTASFASVFYDVFTTFFLLNWHLRAYKSGGCECARRSDSMVSVYISSVDFSYKFQSAEKKLGNFLMLTDVVIFTVL